MKRVLVIITTAFVRTGGLASVMMNYWRAMDKTGLSFDFASTNEIENLLYEEISKEGCRYFQLPPRKNVPTYFNTLRKLCNGYDIVHVHANSATSVIELLAAKMAGVPKRIHHNHTSKTQHPLLSKLLYPLFKCTYTDAVACSEPAGEWLFGRDEFVVGHIGKFMDAKNHDFLIKVFAVYHSNHPQTRLMLVGDGAWRSKVEGWVAQSGCADSIILAGLRSDIPSIVQAFDVFVFPSIYEGLPLTVLEAQSSGLPCIISSNVTKAVDVGRDVVMKDLADGKESWADAIDGFDYSISREEHSCQNQKLITEAHFNIKSEANKLLNIYLK